MDDANKASVRNYSTDENEEDELMDEDLRRGPWTVEEDFTLINYIAHHGEGRWNSLSRCAGLKRTGKSCRLRWLNYLRPDVRRGNITLEEQLLILELHSRWGNRWSKIAQHLPGRTDNEIKNYWRTRVQKHAKQLKCDVNSKQFKDTMRYLWMPRLVERIQAAAATTTSTSSAPLATSSSTTNYSVVSSQHDMIKLGSAQTSSAVPQPPVIIGTDVGVHTHTPENSSAAASSDSFGTPASDLTTTDCYNNYPPVNQGNDYYPANYDHQLSNYGGGDQSFISTGVSGYFNQGLDFVDQQNSQWMDGGDASGNLWNVDDDMWFLPHQF